MVNYIWKATFILNNASCDRTFHRNGWMIESIPPDHKIRRVKLTKNFEETTCRDYWTVFHDIDTEFAKLLNASMSGLLFYQNLGHFPIVSEKNLELMNTSEIHAAGQEVPIRLTMTVTNTLDLSENHFDAVLRNLRVIENSANRDLIHHCLHLFREGLSHSDYSDKFFTLWRAFNALYNHLSLSRYELTNVKGSIDQLSNDQVDLIIDTFRNVTIDDLRLVLLNQGSNLFNYLANSGCVDDRGNDRSQELQSALTTGNRKDIVRRATLCFYVLRCKFAHGSDQMITQNEALFKAGSYYLSLLLSILINNLAR